MGNVKLLRFIKIVVINIISFLILLVLVNWICGVYLKRSAPQNNRDNLPNYAQDKDYAKAIFTDYNRVQHHYEPFVGWKFSPYKGKTLHIDAAGNRVHTPPPYTHPREKVVRFFGGSTIWGEGSDDTHTIPALFNKEFPQFEVYNHGQLAYNTRQELDALINMYSRGEKADIVIFYDGVNDAAFLCPAEITFLPAHRLVPTFREKLFTSKKLVIKELLSSLFIENIIKVVHKMKETPESKKSMYNCISDPVKSEQIAEIFMINWELAHDIVTKRGGKFIAILQPAALVGNTKTDHLVVDPELKNNFRDVYQRIKKKIAERKYSWIYDLSNKLDRDEYIFIDFCHVSPNGNQIMAEEITNIVKQVQPD